MYYRELYTTVLLSYNLRYGDSLSIVVSFRIPKKLKERMDALRDRVNWSEEVRRFIEERVRLLEQVKAIEELEGIIKQLPKVPRGTTIKYVREDRDRY